MMARTTATVDLRHTDLCPGKSS